jgi:hypothetical protein
MGTVIKVECEGQLRRARLKDAPSFNELEHAVQTIWPGRITEGAFYKDEVGNTCQINEQTFTQFLLTATPAANGTTLSFQLPPASNPPAEREEQPSVEDAFSQPWELVEESGEEGDDKHHTVADLTDTLETAQEASHGSQELCTGAPHNDPQEASMDVEPPQDEQRSSADQIQEDIDSHGIQEKVDIVLAAYDDNGDGHLNFKESSDLHSAWGEELSLVVFEEMCKERGKACDQGLDREALVNVYKRDLWNLDNDFAAAMSRLGAA